MVKHDPVITSLNIPFAPRLKLSHAKKTISHLKNNLKVPSQISNLNDLKQQHHFF